MGSDSVHTTCFVIFYWAGVWHSTTSLLFTLTNSLALNLKPHHSKTTSSNIRMILSTFFLIRALVLMSGVFLLWPALTGRLCFVKLNVLSNENCRTKYLVFIQRCKHKHSCLLLFCKNAVYTCYSTPRIVWHIYALNVVTFLSVHHLLQLFLPVGVIVSRGQSNFVSTYVTRNVGQVTSVSQMMTYQLTSLNDRSKVFLVGMHQCL